MAINNDLVHHVEFNWHASELFPALNSVKFHNSLTYNISSVDSLILLEIVPILSFYIVVRSFVLFRSGLLRINVGKMDILLYC